MVRQCDTLKAALPCQPSFAAKLLVRHKNAIMLQKIRGFTLVEMMVTIAIMVFLLLVALPLGLGWMHSIQVSKSKDLMMEGVANARTFAMRNPYQIHASATNPRPAVARMELTNGVLTVFVECAEAVATCTPSTGQAVWSSDISRGDDVKVVFGNAQHPQTTAEFDSTGMLIAPIEYTISKGAEYESDTLR